MKILTSNDVALLASWHVLARTLWAGAVILIAMLFDARTPWAAKLIAAAAAILLVWPPWLVLTVWMAKAGIPKSDEGARYAALSDSAKARLIAAYSGFG
jgi:hypothetical protein